MRTRKPIRGALGAAAMVVALSAPHEPAALEAVTPAPASGHVGCGAVDHPLRVNVVPLDPIVRGGVLRARVDVTASIDLDEVTVSLVETGGVSPVGALSRSLGRVGADAPASARFDLALPAQGRRFFLEFRVRGQGPAGTLTRGAVLNLLPDGSLETARQVVAPDGRRLREVEARRID